MFPDSVRQVYQKFYAQREVLKGAPQLTIDADKIGMAEFPAERALNEMATMVAYLLGRRDISQMSFPEKLRAVQDAYGSQPFWRELLLDYLEMTIDVREVELKEEKENVLGQVQDVLNKMNEAEEQKVATIQYFADKIKEAKFRVDGKALLGNYFKMMKKDAEKAWEVLTTNPGYFSPIQTQDNTGKVVLSPAEAVDENRRLAGFLKKLKG